MFDEKDKEDKRNRVKQIVELKEDELFKKFRYMCVCLAKNWEYVRIKGKFVTVETGTELNSEPISLSRWYYSLDLPQAS